MAGAGSRFSQKFKEPKPFIKIGEQEIVAWVIKSLIQSLQSIETDLKFIYVVRKEHLDEFDVVNFLNKLTPNCEIVTTEGLTEGAACTVLLSKEYINNDKPLLIADSDSIVVFKSKIRSINDGAIFTFEDDKPCWSYVDAEENFSSIKRVAEKEVISKYASCGRYYWSKGSDFVYYAEKMIESELRIKNEFYVSPVFNLAIDDNKIIQNILVEEFINLGSPEDLDKFSKKLSSEKCNHNY
jgi:dTDP-glucose pyrophosphorylase